MQSLAHRDRPLQRQQLPLDRQASAKAGQGAIGTDDAMAGNDDGQWICAIGEADGAAGAGLTDAPGQLPIGDGLTVGNALQLAPYAVLENTVSII